MGSHKNFQSLGYAQPPLPEGCNGSRNPAGNLPLAWEPSIYSLTFDEFQNTYSGVGKDFGSMNMDELLKNIWTAEETHNMTPYTAGGSAAAAAAGGSNLQRQGSVALPRTLSLKTVEEVYKDILRGGNGGNENGSGSNMPHREPTLGEMTLEDFLARAGVVREDNQQFGVPNNAKFFGEMLQVDNNSCSTNNNSNNNNFGSAAGLQKTTGNSSVLANQNMENNYAVPNQLPVPALNPDAARSSRHSTMPFDSPMNTINNTQVASPGERTGATVGMADPLLNNNLAQNGEVGLVGLGTVAAGRTPPNWIPSDVIRKSNVDMGLSASPYVFNGASRGRKSGVVEKVVERRQRRMIKNRESAARSRARKQAYTLELEAEITKLKEMNQELRKKQAEIMEMHKNQIMDTKNQHRGNKKPCLRRTLTGPW